MGQSLEARTLPWFIKWGGPHEALYFPEVALGPKQRGRNVTRVGLRSGYKSSKVIFSVEGFGSGPATWMVFEA